MSGTGCPEATENILKASISETMRQFLTGTSRCRHVRTGGEVLHVRVVVHPQGGQADVAQDDPAVRDAPVLRALEAERVEAPQAGALAQEPADQADSGDGGDGFVSLCYISHGNLAGEWLMCFRQYT